MVSSERLQSFSEFLDKEKKNKLFVRFVFSQDFKEVEEFAVVFLTFIEEKHFEVVRFDCNRFEAVNKHSFYSKKPEKVFLNKEKSFETVKEFVEDIEKNWRNYLTKFLEK